MSKPAAKQPIPKFKSEAQERAYWESHDSSAHLDWTQAQKVKLPNLRPTTKTISLRLPQHLLDSIKVAANARDVPYQSLIKVWLQEKLHNTGPTSVRRRPVIAPQTRHCAADPTLRLPRHYVPRNDSSVAIHGFQRLTAH
jgi:predicted DNA binding CopG/RHH family protein